MSSGSHPPAPEDVLGLLDGLIPPGDESVAAVKTFSTAADHLFKDKAFFHARYLDKILHCYRIIQNDLAVKGIQVSQVNHDEFKDQYGMSLSRFFDYQKLDRSEELRKLALDHKLTSRALRAYSVGAAAQPMTPLPQPFAQSLAELAVSNTNNAPPTQHYRYPRIGKLAPVRKHARVVHTEIQEQMRSCLADGCVGEIKLEAIRPSGSKMKEYNMLAETLSNAPEMVLYHGTSRERMDEIAKHGLQVRFAQGGADDGQVEQKVSYLTSNPSVADSWCRGEITVGGQPGSEEGPEEECAEGATTTQRHMVAFRALLPPTGDAGAFPSGCTGNNWKYTPKALRLLLPIYKITYTWNRPGVYSKSLKPSYPEGLEGKRALEEGTPENRLAMYEWFLHKAVVVRGHVTPRHLAAFFGTHQYL